MLIGSELLPLLWYWKCILREIFLHGIYTYVSPLQKFQTNHNFKVVEVCTEQRDDVIHTISSRRINFCIIFLKFGTGFAPVHKTQFLVTRCEKKLCWECREFLLVWSSQLIVANQTAHAGLIHASEPGRGWQCNSQLWICHVLKQFLYVKMKNAIELSQKVT